MIRVFFFKGDVFNVEEECPTFQRYIDIRAEEIPLSTFKGFERFANSRNTRKIGDLWVFDMESVRDEEYQNDVDEEQEWASERLGEADIQVNYHVDKDHRKIGTIEEWSTYRIMLRDYVHKDSDGKWIISETRPEPPYPIN